MALLYNPEICNRCYNSSDVIFCDGCKMSQCKGCRTCYGNTENECSNCNCDKYNKLDIVEITPDYDYNIIIYLAGGKAFNSWYTPKVGRKDFGSNGIKDIETLVDMYGRASMAHTDLRFNPDDAVRCVILQYELGERSNSSHPDGKLLIDVWMMPRARFFIPKDKSELEFVER